MVIMLAPLYAQSENDFEVRQNADNTLTITGYKGAEKNVVIPDTLYGLKVTIIGKEAFRKKGIISVVIPDTVISIEHVDIYHGVSTEYDGGAFSDNLTLTKLTLGKGLKTIGGCAFSRTGLIEVIIPDSVTVIGDAAFGWFSSALHAWTGEKGESKLVKVTLGKGLQVIGEDAFIANKIEELNLPSSLREIKNNAFAGNQIQKVTFNTGLETIGIGAFQNNKILELELPSSLKEIKDYTFADNQIQKVTFGTRLELIGRWAFNNNQIIELTTLPSSLKVIRGGAFQNNQMKTVIIPNGVSSIENTLELGYRGGAFGNNPLTTVVIPLSLAKSGIQYNGDGNNNPEYYLPFSTKIGSTITRITIPAGMNEDILKGVFEDSFVNFWINQNRAGGTYVKRGPIWTKE
jgi:hypothetical protein